MHELSLLLAAMSGVFGVLSDSFGVGTFDLGFYVLFLFVPLCVCARSFMLEGA